MQTLSILTFNAGLLNIGLGGWSIILPTDYIDQRLRLIPAELIRINAHIIALQEVYEESHRAYLIVQLKEYYPYHFYQKNGVLRIDNGLMFFSKYPITNNDYYKFNEGGSFDENLATDKGVLSITVEANALGQFTLYNTHLTSGGFFRKQDDSVIEKKREKQITEVLDLTKKDENSISIILGDFNSGPEISADNYKFLLSNGYIDSYKEACADKINCSKVTWDSLNVLNVKGPHPTSPSQRIDHIYLSESTLKTFEIENSKIVFNKPIVEVLEDRNGKIERIKVPLSDHYGLRTVIGMTSLR